MYSELIDAIDKREAILFVGSGISASLGTPTWSGLIDEIARQLDFDPEVLAAHGATYLTIAEYYKTINGDIGNLRSWMDVNWKVDDKRILESRVHNIIFDLDFSIIYTTNYDRNLERLYELKGAKFRKIDNIAHLRGSPARTDIVKFHGDFSSDSSIVITESDYYDRLSFDSPLDIRLRSDIIGRVVLFIGYSLQDINIRLLLYKLRKLWSEFGRDKDRPKLYVFLARPDPINEAVLANWGVETIKSNVDDPNDALCSFLEELSVN